MDAGFCVTAMHEEIVRFGRPESFNRDQGPQLISFTFINILTNPEFTFSEAASLMRKAEPRLHRDGSAN